MDCVELRNIAGCFSEEDDSEANRFPGITAKQHYPTCTYYILYYTCVCRRMEIRVKILFPAGWQWDPHSFFIGQVVSFNDDSSLFISH